MSNVNTGINTVMAWVDFLPEVTPALKAMRDEVRKTVAEASELAARAEKLRENAYFAACKVEAEAKKTWTNEAVERAKRAAG